MLPTPPPIEGAHWRPATVDDAQIISDLQQAGFVVDGGYRVTPEEFSNELADPDNSLPEDSLLAVDGSGRAVAFVYVQMPKSFERQVRIFGWEFVHPEHRGQGIEEFLLDWYEARGRHRADAVPRDGPALLRTTAYDWQRDEIDRLDAHGFEPLRYFVELARDLSVPAEPVPLADGYIIDPWPDDSEEIRLLHNEAFRDHWGSEPRSADEWQRYDLDEFFRKDLSAVVTNDGHAVAYLRTTVYPHDFKDRGRTEAWMETLGTARSHRKRGLASALIAGALATYREAGFQFAAIGVDSESPTGALRLYESLGFEVERRSIWYGKSLG